MNYDEDLDELDRIWPLGKQLIIPDGGTVLVAGAYEGRYMDYVLTRYNPKLVLGFEPQYQKCTMAFERLQRHRVGWDVSPFGIGVHDCEVVMINEGTDGCKVFTNRMGSHSRFTLRGIDQILDESGPFDLFICNMEGYEIPLLSYLMATGRIEEIKSLAVQFHSENGRVASMLAEHYGVPVYGDFPKWLYYTNKGRQK